MKIYTKTGDKGETSLYCGVRVAKNDPVVKAIGAVDECNSTIGIAISLLPQDTRFEKVRHQLEVIQHGLFDLGAALATPLLESSRIKIEKTHFDEESTTLLEHWIDQMEEALPQLKTFILPGGTPSGASLHLARGICRRAEREVVSIQAQVSPEILMYLNRLSDYLFVVSRHVNHLSGSPETTWKKHYSKKEDGTI